MATVQAVLPISGTSAVHPSHKKWEEFLASMREQGFDLRPHHLILSVLPEAVTKHMVEQGLADDFAGFPHHVNLFSFDVCPTPLARIESFEGHVIHIPQTQVMLLYYED